MAGEVFNPGGPCQEIVHVDGMAQMVVDVNRAKGGTEIAVYISLAEVHGEGETTGARYLATGFATVRQPLSPRGEPRVTQVVFDAVFAWLPLGACRLSSTEAETLTVPLELAFDAAGNLLPGGTLAAIAVPNFITYRNK
jgi:hypothetical protein